MLWFNLLFLAVNIALLVSIINMQKKQISPEIEEKQTTPTNRPPVTHGYLPFTDYDSFIVKYTLAEAVNAKYGKDAVDYEVCDKSPVPFHKRGYQEVKVLLKSGKTERLNVTVYTPYKPVIELEKLPNKTFEDVWIERNGEEFKNNFAKENFDMKEFMSKRPPIRCDMEILETKITELITSKNSSMYIVPVEVDGKVVSFDLRR